MEPLLEILVEFVLQVLLEVLANVGLHRASGMRAPAPWFAVVGYAVLGAAAGGVSLLVFPQVWLGGPVLRWANLVLTPIAVGFVMAALGRWRERHGRRTIRLDRFACGYVFALAVAVVRFTFGG